MVRSFVFSLAAVLCANAWAQVGGENFNFAHGFFKVTPQVQTRQMQSFELPSLLFRWFSAAEMKSLGEKTSPNSLPMQKILPDSPIAQAYPSLIGHPVLFAWQNVATGLGVSKLETDAPFDEETNEPPRLLVIKINKKAKAFMFVDDLNRKSGRAPESLTGYDLVLHIVVGEKQKIILREWIILNPNAAANYTASASVTRKIVNDMVELLNSENWQFFSSDIHYADSEFNSPETAKAYLESILGAWDKSQPLAIPRAFIRDIGFR